MGESANPLTWNSSPLAPARGASTSSSPAHERDQQRPPSSPLGPYGAQRARPVTPGSFVSPRHSKEYPIPSTTADVLEARRQAFFTRGGSAQHSQRQSFNPRANDGPSLQPGPSSASRRSAYKQPPSAARPSFGGAVAGSLTDDGDITASLYRQRFRERCQAVMARDRGRNKALAKARGRDVLAGDDDEDDQDVMRRLRSDDLSSSDMEGEAPGWQEDDEELIRRVMLAEYRRLLNAQEYSGQRELGWLGADEMAWLEEESRRDDQMTDRQEEPPSEFFDEEAALYEQYQNAIQQQQQQQQAGADGDLDLMEGDDDDTIFADASLLELEGGSNGDGSSARMDTS